MSVTKYRGIFPALLTPMFEDGSIDFDSLRNAVDHLLNQGVHGFYVGGSTGEGFIISKEERKLVLEAVVDAVAEQSTIIAHIGAISTQEAAELADHAQQTGADAISAVVPFYYKITQKEIEEHYLSIMSAVDLQMIIYHFPAATGVNLSLDFYEKMAKHPQCIGVKFTSLNLFEMQQIRERCGEDFLIYNGHDEVYAAGALMGADGAIGSTFSMMPGPFIDMFNKVKQRDWEGLKRPQAAANEIISHMLNFDVIPYEKYISYLQGVFRTPKVRQPLKQLTAEEREQIEQFYKHNEVLLTNK